MRAAQRKAQPQESALPPLKVVAPDTRTRDEHHRTLDHALDALPPGNAPWLLLLRARVTDLEAQVAELRAHLRLPTAPVESLGYPVAPIPEMQPVPVHVPCVQCGAETDGVFLPMSDNAYVERYGCHCVWDEQNDARMEDAIRAAAQKRRGRSS